jgi:2-keto-3-deoxy-L-rhamnonate aldolase RhmA
MRTLRLRQALNEKRPFLGIQCFIGTPTIIEVLGQLEFDFVMIDTEHTSLNPETVEYMVRVADSVNVTPLVRVAANDPILIMKALDTGAAGVIVPHVLNAEDAKRAVEAAKYAPHGQRGVCSGVRGAGFSKEGFVRHWRHANENVLVIPILEDLEAIDNAVEIMSVPGVELVWFGPGDLAQSIRGKYAGDEAPVATEIENAFDRTISASRQTGVPVMSLHFHTTSFADSARIVKRGALGIMYSIDVLLIRHMMQKISDTLGSKALQNLLKEVTPA